MKNRTETAWVGVRRKKLLRVLENEATARDVDSYGRSLQRASPSSMVAHLRQQQDTCGPLAQRLVERDQPQVGGGGESKQIRIGPILLRRVGRPR